MIASDTNAKSTGRRDDGDEENGVEGALGVSLRTWRCGCESLEMNAT